MFFLQLSTPSRFAPLLALLLLPSTARTQTVPPEDPDLERLLGEVVRLESLSGGVMGVGAVHLETGREVYLRPDEPFPMASTYKVPIAVQLLTRLDRGEISLSDLVDLNKEDLHPGSGMISDLLDDPGVVLSLRNLLELMLLISDNSATDLILATAGGGGAVTGRMRALGIEGIRVDRPTSVLIGDYMGVRGLPPDGGVSPDTWEDLTKGLDEPERAAAAEAFAQDLRDTATPRAMAKLLQELWHGSAVSPESTELLLDILRRVQTGRERIKGMLPPETTVAHKTGTIGGTTNDVGIIHLPGDAGHVVAVLFIKESGGSLEAREQAIAQASRAIYDFFLFNPEG